MSAYVFVIEQICSNFAPVFAQPSPQKQIKGMERSAHSSMGEVSATHAMRRIDTNDIRTKYLTITQKL